MKKLLVVLFCLLFASVSFAEHPCENMTHEQERVFINYVIEDITETVVRGTDWTEDRTYDKEVKEIGKIIRKYGFTEQEYGIKTDGFIDVNGKIIVVSIHTVIKGFNQTYWKVQWVDPTGWK